MRWCLLCNLLGLSYSSYRLFKSSLQEVLWYWLFICSFIFLTPERNYSRCSGSHPMWEWQTMKKTNREAKLVSIDCHRISDYIPLCIQQGYLPPLNLPSVFARVSEIVVRNIEATTIVALSFGRNRLQEIILAHLQIGHMHLIVTHGCYISVSPLSYCQFCCHHLPIRSSSLYWLS